MFARKLSLVSVVLLSTVLMAVAMAPGFGGTTGIVTGVITDAESGQKLAGVNVIIEGTDLTTVTDQNGYFVITNVPPGHYRVTASLVGYSDAEVAQVSILMDVTSTVDVAMSQAIAEDEATIIAEARPLIHHNVTPTMYIVDDSQVEQIKSQPNLMYTVPGLVKTQPGVVADASGVPHIRGGRADQIGWTIDGIPVHDPVSNGFGTNLVTVGMDKMEIFTGGYRPEYGNAISGVFNEVVKTGRTSEGNALEMMTGNMDYQGFYPEIGGVLTNGADYYMGAYVWKSDLDDVSTNHVDSSDIVGKFNYPIGKKDKLTFLALQGSEKYLIPSTHTESVQNGVLVTVPETQDYQNQSHLLSALTWSHTVDSKSFFTLRPYYFRSRNRMDGIGANDNSGFFIDSESQTNGLMFDYANQITPKHLVKAGYVRMSSNNKYEAIVPYMDDMYNYYFGTTLTDYQYAANTDSTKTGFYVQDQISMSEKWALEMGLRYDKMKYDKLQNSDTSESQWSPRLGFAYSANANNKLRLTWGKMIQFPRTQSVERIYTDPGWIDQIGLENADPSAERCTQWDIGWEHQFSSDYLLQVTPFYRKYRDLLQARLIDPDNPYGPTVYENLGEGKSKGLELLIKKQPSKNLSGWLAYTWMKSQALASDDRTTVTPGQLFYVNWDQRQTASMGLNYTKGKWTYSLIGEYGSGLPYGDNNSKRIHSHMVVDLNISREVKGGWLPEGKWTFGIANLFNTRDILDGEDVTDFDEEGNPIGSHFEPTARISPTFINTTFTRRF